MSLSPRHQVLWERIQPPPDLAHDGEHLLRVYRWALHLSPEAGADPDLAGAAALVHDLVDIPKESEQRSLGGQRSAEASVPLLSEVGYTPAQIQRVYEAVRTSSWSRGLAPTCPEGVVLQDADRLDAIGAIGIARTLTTAQVMASRGSGSSLYEPRDPLALSGRPLDDRRWAVDHFAAKLLRLAEGMHTHTARAEAARRHQVMLDYLAALERELSPAASPPRT